MVITNLNVKFKNLPLQLDSYNGRLFCTENKLFLSICETCSSSHKMFTKTNGKLCNPGLLVSWTYWMYFLSAAYCCFYFCLTFVLFLLTFASSCQSPSKHLPSRNTVYFVPLSLFYMYLLSVNYVFSPIICFLFQCLSDTLLLFFLISIPPQFLSSSPSFLPILS